jgi:hypothetical protein
MHDIATGLLDKEAAETTAHVIDLTDLVNVPTVWGLLCLYPFDTHGNLLV